MLKTNSRTAVLLAILSDIVGYSSMLTFYISQPKFFNLEFANDFTLPFWLLPSIQIFLYLFFNWIFGAYKLIRWRIVDKASLIRRIFLASLFTIVSFALIAWLFNISDNAWIFHRRFQVFSTTFLIIWSSFIRLLLRILILKKKPPSYLLVGSHEQTSLIANLWNQVKDHDPLSIIDIDKFINRFPSIAQSDSLILAFAPNSEESHKISVVISELKTFDPRQIMLLTPLRMVELQQERLLTELLPEYWLSYGEIPWSSPFSLQAQLKRFADVFLSLILLIIFSPLLLLASIGIWLFDFGPVLYTQTRSGWLNKPFKLYKLRTMKVDNGDTQTHKWTQVKDSRITPIGIFLRKTRIDELPQLINVLNGTMSLIGPRPERPEYESELETHIRYYRVRHWMRPGLSGWAQVCSPYASNIDEIKVKLSYDLFYIKNFSCGLDFLILFKTIKTILKASGR